jgi:tRNA dimethylallyltransferase
MPKLPKLIVILGPTASGKTEMALKLAKKFNGEIVNADSRQIYRGMDIGTGKVKVEAKRRHGLRQLTPIVSGGVPHYLIDIVEPDEEFTVAEYKKMAVKVIRDILKRGKQPFLVGGTGLYIQAVVDNLIIPRVPPDKELRARFEREFKKSTIENRQSEILNKWYKKLLKLDPEAIHVVDPKNPRRIIRALEVCLATHQPFSRLRQKGKPLFDVLQIGIEMPREKLYERIDKRVDQMIKEGLIEETKNLINRLQDKSYKLEEIWNLPSMSGIGYKEIGEFLKQESRIKSQESRENLLAQKIQEIKWRTHGYARRQLMWFYRDKRIIWVKNYREAERKIAKWLSC